MNRRTLGTLAVVLGLLVAVNPLYLGLWSDAAHFSAEPVAPETVEAAENRTVYEYEDLSDRARLVVDRTITDGRYTVLGPSNRPDEFVYPGGLDSRPGEYFVERDGNYYSLRTSGDVFGGVYLAVQVGLVALGALAASAGLSARRGERNPAVAALVGVVAVVLTALGPPLGFPVSSVARWSFAVLGAAGVVVLGAIGLKIRALMANS